jgi:glyoxylase-like metal-dependent hydrolase (beta-lactamase superfamily II)
MKVVRVLAPNPGPFTLEGTNAWVLGEEPTIVIDPGPDDPVHIRTVREAAGVIGAIVLTHHHPDHAPGAARLAELSLAPVYAYLPDAGEVAIQDRQFVEAGRVRIRAVHTPGHASDHLVFWAEEPGYLFTGDAVLGRGTSVVDPPDGDMAAYIRSLEVMQRLGPRVIYPGHGPVVFDGPGKLDEYIRHRRHRERQVLSALASGKTSAEELVPSIYGVEVPGSMYPAAARSVLAHLIKLEREGKVARTGPMGEDRFVLVPPRECARCGRQAAPGSRFCRQCGLAQLQEGVP